MSSLLAELQEIARQEWSEADTLDKVILRALREFGGYGYVDYRSQQSTASGYPDVSVLPGTPQEWVLEAKATTIDLNDQHAVQALNYANARGLRWVVLTNGRRWRLYDQHKVGRPEDKLLIEVDIDQTEEIRNLLQALGKASVQAGEVETRITRRRVKRVLDQQLCRPDSEVVNAIADKLREMGLNAVTAQMVVEYFASTTSPPRRPGSMPGDAAPIVDYVGPTTPQPLTRLSMPLDELARRAEEVAVGRKPRAVVFPDGRRVEVRFWHALMVGVVQWFGDRLPEPPQPFEKGHPRYLYHSLPHHEGQKMGVARRLRVGNRDLYVETKVGTSLCLRSLVYLCECTGEPASGFRIELTPDIRHKSVRERQMGTDAG